MEKIAKHRIIGLDREMMSFTDWLADSRAQTSIFQYQELAALAKQHCCRKWPARQGSPRCVLFGWTGKEV